MFYSKLQNGFFTPEIHGENMPPDAVEITQEEYESVMTKQANGYRIVGGDDGKPTAVEVPTAQPTYAQLRARAYPDYREYLDGIVKGDQAQVQAYIDSCLAVKEKYPKSE
jgi:hypothetical protein